MGNEGSKPSRPPTKEELIEKQGVLIPPSFAITTTGLGDKTKQQDGGGATCLSAYDRIPLNPSLVEYMTLSQFSQGLLYDYMTPGMWVLASGGADTTVRASLPQKTTSSPTRGGGGPGGSQISFSSRPAAAAASSSGSQIELRAGTEGPINFFAKHQFFGGGGSENNGLNLFANINTEGSGYLGGQVGLTVHRQRPQSQSKIDDDQTSLLVEAEEEDDDDSFNKIRFKVGSWIPLNTKTGKRQRSITTTTSSDNIQKREENLYQKFLPNQPPEVVHGYMSVEMLGSTTVLESKWNSDTLETETSKYFSVQLNGPAGSAAAAAVDDEGDDFLSTTTPRQPPLWLTMTSTPQTSTINISQLFSFDRTNFGFDERAPKIRNTFGWCVQLEKPNNNNSGGDSTNGSSSDSKLSVAAAWQVNRGLGFKVVGSSSGGGNIQDVHSLTYAAIFKSWRQPRITCSLLGKYNFPGITFVGMGLEIETDVLTNDNNYAPRSAQVTDQHYPETKASLG